jgi:hypothetical protein
VQDRTVPYPTASFSSSDPFADHDETGIIVDADADGVVLGWRPGRPRQESTVTSGPKEVEDAAAVADEVMASSSITARAHTGWLAAIRNRTVGRRHRHHAKASKKQKRKAKWAFPALPPAFQYRFPFNYVSPLQDGADSQLILLFAPVMLPILITLMYVVELDHANM